MPLLTRDDVDLPRLERIERDLPRAVSKHRKVCFRSTIARERDGLPIGRPLWLQVAVPVVRELREMAAVGVDDVQIADSAKVSREDDARSIGRPRRTSDSLEMGVDAANHLPLAHIEQVEHVLPFALRRERERPAIRRERALGVEEAKLLELGVSRTLH